ncbi:MAG: AEC family transporter [Holdemanella porci]
MNLLVLITTMIELFAMILVGFFLGKKEIINTNQNRCLSFLAAHVFSPCLVIGSVFSQSSNMSESLIQEALYCGLCFYLFLFLFSILLFKIIKIEKDVIYRLSFIFYNTGFIGYPIVSALYGQSSIFLFSILHLSYNFFIFSYGIYCLGGNQFHLKEMMTPGLLGSIVALIFYFFHLSLPQFCIDFFQMMGSATIPVSMLVIGVSLSFVPISSLKNKTMISMVFLKLIGMPLLFFILCRWLPFSDFMKDLLILSCALPAGSMLVILANQYKQNEELAASLVFVSTFASIFTIPVLLNVLL